MIATIGIQRFWQRPDWSWKGPRLPLVFAALFVLIWPVFYDSGVSSRFVASYTGALLALGTAIILQTSGRLRDFILGATVVLGLSVSHTDVLVRKLIDWNMTDVIGAFMPQFPRLLASLTVNSFASKHATFTSFQLRSELAFLAASTAGPKWPRRTSVEARRP